MFQTKVDSESDFKIWRINTLNSYVLNIAGVETIFPANQDRWSYCRMQEKYECLIEVKIVYASERWQELVSGKMRQAIEKLRAAVEEMGGKICVRC
jgi:hypothetical protein